MELMFAGLAGILIGFAARYLDKNHKFHGFMLVPALGGITALVVWEALTWLWAVPGFGWVAYNNGWIWWVTLGITIVVTVVTSLTLGSSRAQRDKDLLDRLSHVGRSAI